MRKLKLLPKLHTTRQASFRLLRDEITSAIEDLDVKIDSLVLDDEGFVTVELSGEDMIAAENYLIKLFGKSHEFNEVKVGDTIKGFICSSGKVGFGIFVDVGIKEPYTIDALLPMYKLREQLCDSAKLPVRKIIELFGLIDNLPLEIVLEDVSVGTKKIEARLSDAQIEQLTNWRDEGLERLIIIGAQEDKITRVLEETEHSHDIINIEKLGWLEHVLTCKFNTTAKGLIPVIGRRIPKAKLEIFYPAKIKSAIKQQKSKDEKN